MKADLAAWGGDLLFRLLAGTVHSERVGHDAVAARLARGEGVLYGLWHGRLLVGALEHRGSGAVVLVSRNEDGEIIARIVGRHGFATVRGSTSRGGGDALEELTRRARAGARELAITPDGPRGPRHVVQPGLVALARRTGYAIVPVGASARPGRIFASWDRFLLPRPGAHAVLVYGEAIVVPPEAEGAEFERLRHRVEEAMIGVEAEADRRVGWPPGTFEAVPERRRS